MASSTKRSRSCPHHIFLLTKIEGLQKRVLILKKSNAGRASGIKRKIKQSSSIIKKEKKMRKNIIKKIGNKAKDVMQHGSSNQKKLVASILTGLLSSKEECEKEFGISRYYQKEYEENASMVVAGRTASEKENRLVVKIAHPCGGAAGRV